MFLVPFLVRQVVLLLSCILAFFLNYSIFLNTTLNSAVTQTICGNLKFCLLKLINWVGNGLKSPYAKRTLALDAAHGTDELSNIATSVAGVSV
ncbi:Nucleotide-sugar uncharacterized transporter 3 [Vitis vinifera]|uniref:Nucleotide-sugar uncharacterized transporter 3 n=1 Tax=Vitis vinifera TaxID=29760 RepID=A0A438KE90_VITVI|nr:Nucleotide-sugar uncharacterized transporter 3 [Vitis vinifera]